MNDYYEAETRDYTFTKGDTAILRFEFVEKGTGNPIDLRQWNSKCTLLDYITNQPITALQKYHDDSIDGGKGIYYYGDTQLPDGITLDTVGKIVIIFKDVDTKTLKPGIYPFDIEFSISTLEGDIFRFTIKGNLIITWEATENV